MEFLCSYVYGKKCFEIRAIWNPRLFTERIKLVRRECHCILIYYPYIIDIDRGYYASSTINYAIHLVCYYIQHLQSNNNYVGLPRDAIRNKLPMRQFVISCRMYFEPMTNRLKRSHHSRSRCLCLQLHINHTINWRGKRYWESQTEIEDKMIYIDFFI